MDFLHAMHDNPLMKIAAQELQLQLHHGILLSVDRLHSASTCNHVSFTTHTVVHSEPLRTPGR